MKNLQGIRNTRQILSFQLLIMLLLMRISDLIFGTLGLITAGLAGVVFILPYAFFAYVVFSDIRASLARQYLRRIYRGEVAKITLSIVLFSVIFYFFKIIPGVFFTVFFMMQFTVWLSPWVFTTRECAQ